VPSLSRRVLLLGGLGLVLAGGGLGYELVQDGTLPGKYELAELDGACGSPPPPPTGPPPSRHTASFYSAYRHRQVQMVTLVPADASPTGLGLVLALHGAGSDAVGMAALTGRPVPGGIVPGCHDDAFWARNMPAALRFIGASLVPAARNLP
jgi:hypothetical protein